MKKLIFAIAFLFVAAFSLSAQEVAAVGNQPAVDLAALYQLDYDVPTNQTTMWSQQNYPCRQKLIGRNLLIAGGCSFAVGATLFPLAYLCISDSPGARELGGVCSIGGVALMGVSVPLFIAGSVLYVKGKNNCMTINGNSVSFNF